MASAWARISPRPGRSNCRMASVRWRQAEARTAIDTLERDLTRAVRRHDASGTHVADHLGLAGRASADSYAWSATSTSLHCDRCLERLRTERARDHAGDAWCQANEQQPCEAMGDLTTVNDT
ncbi:hypothetical protein NKH77_00300 [Streptomyces sp. M19]